MLIENFDTPVSASTPKAAPAPPPAAVAAPPPAPAAAPSPAARPAPPPPGDYTTFSPKAKELLDDPMLYREDLRETKPQQPVVQATEWGGYVPTPDPFRFRENLLDQPASEPETPDRFENPFMRGLAAVTNLPHVGPVLGPALGVVNGGAQVAQGAKQIRDGETVPGWINVAGGLAGVGGAVTTAGGDKPGTKQPVAQRWMTWLAGAGNIAGGASQVVSGVLPTIEDPQQEPDFDKVAAGVFTGAGGGLQLLPDPRAQVAAAALIIGAPYLSGALAQSFEHSWQAGQDFADGDYAAAAAHTAGALVYGIAGLPHNAVGPAVFNQVVQQLPQSVQDKIPSWMPGIRKPKK